MKTLEELRRHIRSVNDMQSVVTTMKMLSAARIRQFETAANATQAYSETVRLSLQVLMRSQQKATLPWSNRRQSREKIGVILLGTDQGFCGRFNEVVSSAVDDFVTEKSDSRAPHPVGIVVGARLQQLVENSDLDVQHAIHVPGSVADITTVIQQIIPQIETWQTELGVQRIEMFYNRRRSAASYEVTQVRLMPLSDDFLNELKQAKWESRSLPIYHLSWTELFRHVIRQYLFLLLFRACAESLASENASRIAAMQQAEKNIEDRLLELSNEFNQVNQRTITEELLDIMTGFAAVTENS